MEWRGVRPDAQPPCLRGLGCRRREPGPGLGPGREDAKGDREKITVTDAEFVAKAADGGQTEVTTSKLAETRGRGAEVKKFAATMIKDHTRANEELLRLAGASGWRCRRGSPPSIRGWSRRYPQDRPGLRPRVHQGPTRRPPGGRRPVRGRLRAGQGRGPQGLRHQDPADPQGTLPDDQGDGRRGRRRRHQAEGRGQGTPPAEAPRRRPPLPSPPERGVGPAEAEPAKRGDFGYHGGRDPTRRRPCPCSTISTRR